MCSISSILLQREIGDKDLGDLSKQLYYKSFSLLDCSSHINKKFSEGLVVEIVSTPSLLFIITSLWHCICIDKDTFSLKFDLNQPNERSRTIFYNRHKNTMILVCVQSSSGNERLKCRSYNLNSIEQGILDCEELFNREDLRTPGFLEFDDINKLVLTKSASTSEYKFWSLENYSLLFTIADPFVEEIRLTTELVMLIHSPQTSNVICKLCSIPNGNVLDVFDISIKPQRLIELLELFGKYLLIKQFGEPLIILNLFDHSYIRISGFLSPQNFIYLHERKLFLALRSCVVEVWNFEGKLVCAYNAPLFTGSGNAVPNRLCLNKSQDVLILSCVERIRRINRGMNEITHKSSIKIFSLLDKEPLMEIKKEILLDNLTTVTYDECYGIIFTGHNDGSITWWGN